MAKIKVELVGGPLDGMIKAVEEVAVGVIVNITVPKSFVAYMDGTPCEETPDTLVYPYRRTSSRTSAGDIIFLWHKLPDW